MSEPGTHRGGRFRTAQVYRTPTAVARGPRLKPGKLAERETAHLRATGGVQVTRAAARRLLKQTIKTMVPVLAEENAPVARRLAARGRHVPAHLTVTPAHQWIITDEALTKVAACFEVEASLLADTTWELADYKGMKSVTAADFHTTQALIEKLRAK